jgi:hypothetical protein
MNWYPSGCKHDKKKEVDVGRWETVRVICETGIVGEYEYPNQGKKE